MPPGAAALEMTVTGATLRFDRDAVIALTGAQMDAKLDGRPVPFWQPIAVPRGSVLALGAHPWRGTARLSRGARRHRRARVPRQPRHVHARTVRWSRRSRAAHRRCAAPESQRRRPRRLPRHRRRAIGRTTRTHWQIAVTDGPHGAPDFFTPEDIDTFFAADWEVHYNSSRTGVRLIGPQAARGRAPMAARRDCIRPTFTTTPTPSAASISPATCR